MSNKNLNKAKNAKNDEFYTQYADIQKEMNAYLDHDANVFRGKTVLLPCDDPELSNFTRYFVDNFKQLGLKKLISTSHAFCSKKGSDGYLLDIEHLSSDASLNRLTCDRKQESRRGKMLVVDETDDIGGTFDISTLKCDNLDGDGDFRSDEIRSLFDEADIIVTNPPFSLFREFMTQVIEKGKKFAIIGNMNAITYKEVFPLFMKNRLWLGATGFSSSMVFAVPSESFIPEAYKKNAERLGYVGDFTCLGNTCWFTNIDYNKRHSRLPLKTMHENLKHSKHKKIKEFGYRMYDNYNALEVPYTDAIPNDYFENAHLTVMDGHVTMLTDRQTDRQTAGGLPHRGIMGVPISFLDKYCPEQFDLVGIANHGTDSEYDLFRPTIDGCEIFKRILIRHKV